MAKTSWKAGTMLYPLPPVMVTCGTMDKPNVLTVAWTGIVNSEPAMTYISVRPSRYSHELISENQEFVINLTTAKTLKAADFCGVKSGRDVNKFAETGLTPVAATTVKAPLIAESPLSLECRVTKVEHLGSHDMFLAEIVAVDVDDEYLDADGKFRLEDSGLIAFCHGGYYALGGKVGSFGFSVEKKKSRKQRITEIKHERRALKKQLDKAERKAAEKTVDHAESVAYCIKAIDAGFDSVMIDASMESLEENILKTKQVVDYAHSRGVLVESEVGKIKNKENGDGKDDSDFLVQVEDAVRLVKETNVDFLAVGIGNQHGFYRGEPRIHFDRLKEVNDALGIPLVMHGGSGIPKETLQRAIQEGITKVNVYTDVASAFSEALKTSLIAQGEHAMFMKSCGEAMEAARVQIRRWIDTCMSSGKANLF